MISLKDLHLQKSRIVIFFCFFSVQFNKKSSKFVRKSMSSFYLYAIYQCCECSILKKNPVVWTCLLALIYLFIASISDIYNN